MSYNTDGFNERTNYIQNANDKARLERNGFNSFDNSFAQMRVSENKPAVETVNTDTETIGAELKPEESGILINNRINNANPKVGLNNPVMNALRQNMFKK